MNSWAKFVQAFNTAGGNLVACLILVVFLLPFLWQNNPKAWEALTFIIGVIGGLVRGTFSHEPTPGAPPTTDKQGTE